MWRFPSNFQNIKLFQILTNFIIIIIFEKLLTLINFTLWTIFSRKSQIPLYFTFGRLRGHRNHYNVLKSCFRVLNLIVESNLLSKSGLRTKIGQFCVEISLLCHQSPVWIYPWIFRIKYFKQSFNCQMTAKHTKYSGITLQLIIFDYLWWLRIVHKLHNMEGGQNSCILNI